VHRPKIQIQEWKMNQASYFWSLIHHEDGLSKMAK